MLAPPFARILAVRGKCRGGVHVALALTFRDKLAANVPFEFWPGEISRFAYPEAVQVCELQRFPCKDVGNAIKKRASRA